MPKKIVFMGTPMFAVPILKSLYQNGYPISHVYTQPPQKSQRGQRINKSPIQGISYHRISAQLVLGLVEPESSGLGGGAFLVYFDNKTKKVTTLDGRETAPLLINENVFQDINGNSLKFFDAVVGGKSVGTPGTPALLEMAYKKWGKTKWSLLFDDAINLSNNGFVISNKLSSSIKKK